MTETMRAIGAGDHQGNLMANRHALDSGVEGWGAVGVGAVTTAASTLRNGPRSTWKWEVGG